MTNNQRSKINDLILIELVRNQSLLYDMSNIRYLDSKLKDEVWKEIGSELKIEGPKCRSRWNNIRDQYKKRLKKTAMQNMHGKKGKDYKYHHQLAFLHKYPNFNDMEGSPDNCNIEVDHDVEENEENSPLNNDTQDSTSSRQDATQEFMPQSFPFQDAMTPLELQQHIEGEGNSQSFQSIYAAASLMGSLLRNVEAKKSDHPIDKFLEGIAPTLKTFSPYSQHLAKTEIFSIVQKYEMQMLKGNINDNELSSTPGKIGRDSPAFENYNELSSTPEIIGRDSLAFENDNELSSTSGKIGRDSPAFENLNELSSTPGKIGNDSPAYENENELSSTPGIIGKDSLAHENENELTSTPEIIGKKSPA